MPSTTTITPTLTPTLTPTPTPTSTPTSSPPFPIDEIEKDSNTWSHEIDEILGCKVQSKLKNLWILIQMDKINFNEIEEVLLSIPFLETELWLVCDLRNWLIQNNYLENLLAKNK